MHVRLQASVSQESKHSTIVACWKFGDIDGRLMIYSNVKDVYKVENVALLEDVTRQQHLRKFLLKLLNKPVVPALKALSSLPSSSIT